MILVLKDKATPKFLYFEDDTAEEIKGETRITDHHVFAGGRKAENFVK